MYNNLIIGFTGKAGAGKDMYADRLSADIQMAERVLIQPFNAGAITRLNGFNANILGFADPIKEMAKVFGCSKEDFEDRIKKETVKPWLGYSPRQIAQKLGTEFGRHVLDPDIWIRLTQRKIEQSLHESVYTVNIIKDVRFENEAEYILSHGGILFEIDRPALKRISESNHPSEAGLPDSIYYKYSHKIYKIINNEGMESAENNAHIIFDVVKQTIHGRFFNSVNPSLMVGGV